jgi:hypothetical protein
MGLFDVKCIAGYQQFKRFRYQLDKIMLKRFSFNLTVINALNRLVFKYHCN